MTNNNVRSLLERHLEYSPTTQDGHELDTGWDRMTVKQTPDHQCKHVHHGMEIMDTKVIILT